MRFSLLAAALLALVPIGCDAPPVAGAEARTVTSTGLDPALIATAVEEADGLPRLNSLIVARDGEVLVERVFRGPDLDTPVNIKSASKSVLAAVAGAAIGQGLLPGVEAPISTWLADDFPANPDPRLNTLTVENLLTMQAGLGSTSGRNYGAWVSGRDWVGFALAQPFEAEPGGRMVYSTGTSHILSALLTEATGRSTLTLTRDLLGEPLGVEIPEWPADPNGVYFGGNDMLMSPRALVTFGELYRNDGLHDGRRVLPEGWVETSWRGRGTSAGLAGAAGRGPGPDRGDDFRPLSGQPAQRSRRSPARPAGSAADPGSGTGRLTTVDPTAGSSQRPRRGHNGHDGFSRGHTEPRA